MSAFEATNDSEDDRRRYIVDLISPRPWPWKTDETKAFIENLHQAEDSRLGVNPPFCKQYGFAEEQDQWDILCLPKPKNKIRTAHALGDECTTVFISEFGELVSFSKFLGLGVHGTVLVEPPIEYGSDRDKEYNDVLDGRLPGVGLRLKDRRLYREQRVDYVHDRWPRVSYKVGDLDIKVQFVVHQGLVAQQYLVKNSSQEPKTCVFNLDLGFGAQPSPMGNGMEDDQPPFVESHIFATAGGYAAMLWAGDGRGQIQLHVALFQDGTSVKLSHSSLGPESAEKVSDQNVKMQESCTGPSSSPHHLHTVVLESGATKELTALYSLERYKPTKEQQRALEPDLDSEKDGRLEGRQATPVIRASESNSAPFGSGIDKTVSVEKPTSDIVPTRLKDTIHGGSKEDDRAQEDSFWDYSGEELPDGLESRLNGDTSSDLYQKMANKHFLSTGPRYIDVSMFLKHNHHGRWTMDSTPTNQLLRRHLQQVLFVNSLSIPRQNGVRSAIVLSEAYILSNAVPNWGSLCMFRFLLSMYIFLGRPKVAEERLREYLKSQIKNTCGRHLDWIFDISRPLEQGWAQVYNLNGSYSKPEKSDWYYGAVQFIKLYEFRMVFQSPEDQLFVLEKLQKRLGPWFESLERLRDAKSDLWASFSPEVNVVWLDPQYRQDEIVHIPEYMVAHLMVLWKAFSFIHELLHESANSGMRCELNSVKASLPSTWRTTFSPTRLRTKIMDYFTYEHLSDQRAPGGHTKEAAAQVGEYQSDKDTIENYIRKVEGLLAMSVKGRKESDPVQKKQLLAFRWAGNDKPSYLWCNEASHIFEAVNSGFFEDESLRRVWKDTLEAQRVHRELSWVYLSTYVLALRAAQHGQSLDMTVDSEEMRKRVYERLLECFYSNGTFPSEIDLTAKQPTSKWWEPGYSSASFEIPLLLLQEETKCLDIAGFLADAGGCSDLSSPHTMPHRGAFIGNRSIHHNARDTHDPEDDLGFDPEAVAKERAKLAKSARHSARSTKVDRANIPDPPDFEPDWLFPYPDCFAFDEPTGTVDETIRIHEQAKKDLEQLRQKSDYHEDTAYRVLEPAIEKYLSNESDTVSDTHFEPDLFRETTVVDVGHTGRSRMSTARVHAFRGLHLLELEVHLLRKRTVKAAKKRLMIIHSCQPKQALLLYLGSAESEKRSTAGFLTRHKMRENFTRDHAHKEINLWVTELHLSFYKKVINSSDHSIVGSLFEKTIFEGPEKLSTIPGEPKSSERKLQKGAIGWRFSGDLHDRRWTGTVLAFVPDQGGDANWIDSKDFLIDKHFHGQRKIIEARLFSDMIKIIYASTKEILRDLDTVLDEGKGVIYRDSTDHHDPFSESFDQSYSRSKLFLQLSDFLGNLDDSVKGVMDTVESYIDREKQRPVQPRWSFEDERLYGFELRKWDQHGMGNVALLRSVRSEIITKMGRAQYLRERLNADLQLREARLQARSAEDVRLFTYVTIIFLPISFSASLFSMQQAPGNNVVGTFAKVAIVALITTLIILFNLKTMSKNLWACINTGLHQTSEIMSISSWKFWKETREDLVQAEKRNIQSDDPLQIHRTSKWWYGLFFVVFVLMELPAIRVLLAYDVCFPPTKQGQEQPTLLKKVTRVVLGLLFLPLFVLFYAILFLLRNLIDLLYQLSSLSGVNIRNDIQDTQASTDPPRKGKSLEFGRIRNEENHREVSDGERFRETAPENDTTKTEEDAGLDKRSPRAREETFNARVARLTHPPRRLRSRAAVSDKAIETKRKNDKQTSRGERDEKLSMTEEGDRDFGIPGIESPAVSTETRTGGFLDKIRWRGISKKASRTAGTLPV